MLDVEYTGLLSAVPFPDNRLLTVLICPLYLCPSKQDRMQWMQLR
jgi:hypothetical protein